MGNIITIADLLEGQTLLDIPDNSFSNFLGNKVDSFLLRYLTHRKINENTARENTLASLNNAFLYEIYPELKGKDEIRYGDYWSDNIKIKVHAHYPNLEGIDQPLIEEKLSNLEKQVNVFTAKNWYNPFTKKAYECEKDYGKPKLKKPTGMFVTSSGTQSISIIFLAATFINFT